MNLSPNIDPAECTSCGLCCKWFSIGYSKDFLFPKTVEERRCLSELERFLDLESGGKIFVVEYPDQFAVVFDYPCKHFKKTAEGVVCAIYGEERPAICEEFPYKKNDCEKYVKPIGKFTDSDSLRKRFEKLREVEHGNTW